MSNHIKYKTSSKQFRKYKVDTHKDLTSKPNLKFNKHFTGLKDVHIGSSIFGIIIMFLFVISFFSYIRTGLFVDFTFKSFIELLSNAPSFDVSWATFDWYIAGPWLVLDELRVFLNWFVDCFEVMVFISGLLVESLQFLLYIVKSFFFF